MVKDQIQEIRVIQDNFSYSKLIFTDTDWSEKVRSFYVELIPFQAALQLRFGIQHFRLILPLTVTQSHNWNTFSIVRTVYVIIFHGLPVRLYIILQSCHSPLVLVQTCKCLKYNECADLMYTVLCIVQMFYVTDSKVRDWKCSTTLKPIRLSSLTCLNNACVV